LLSAGRVSSLVALVLIFLCIRLGLSIAQKKQLTFRRIAGLDAVEEAVGRATEMGRPVAYSPGYQDVSGTVAPASLAGLDLLAHVGRLTARYDTDIVVTVGHPNTYALALEVLRGAYLAEGKPDAFSPESVYFTSEVQFAFAAATLGVVQREKPAATFYTGYFAAEAIILAEAAAAVNSITIAGTTNYFQIPFFVASCDYTMIGEEFLAAGAFISGDPKRIGSVAGQDYVKIVAIAFILLGVVLRTINITWLADFLSK
jgi:hypothetical protein